MDLRIHQPWITALVTAILACAQAVADPVTAATTPLDSSVDVAGEIKLQGTLTGESWRSVSDGARPGSWWNTLLDVGCTLDLAKLDGPAGGSLFVQAHWVQNRDGGTCFAASTGAFNPVSGLMASDHVRVFNLYYRQSWCGGAIGCKVGQLALDDDFMGSAYAALFANSAFGAMPSQVGTPLPSACGYTSAFPIYPVAAPGVWLQLRPRAAFSWQMGIYDGGPGPDSKDNHGFDWDRSAHSGVLMFTEASWSYRLADGDATLRVGGSYHNGHFENYDANQAGRTATIAHGLASFYAVHDLVLATDTAGQPKLAVFGRVGRSPQQDRSVVTTCADAGFNWFAPLPARSSDVAGAAISCTKFGRAFRRATAPDGSASTETTLELTYRARLTPRCSVQVDAQLLFKPTPDTASGRREVATVLGLRTQISF
ncbi:MAG: carbohydrate porin [Opitutaceae bacterium]|nr:carbohydrate porin [Opitutaceae bacterium]